MGEIKIGDTVRVLADGLDKGLWVGHTGVVFGVRENGRRPEDDRILVRTDKAELAFARSQVELVGEEQTAVEKRFGTPDPLTRAKSKAQRQQVKAAEKMRLAARYLNDLAEKCENGKRVESLRNETELLVQAQFFLGQADALRDLEEWIGEGE